MEQNEIKRKKDGSTREMLLQAYERFGDALVIFDKDWRFVYLNSSAGKIANRDPGSLVGKLLKDEFPQAPLGAFKQLSTKAEETATPQNMEFFYAPLDKWLNLIIYTDPETISVYVKDFTEEKRALLALRDSEEKYFRMVDAVEDYSIFMLDKQGNIQTWNKGAEKMKGYSEKEIVGKNFGLFFTVEDRRANVPVQLLQKAIAEGKADIQRTAVRKDSSTFWTSDTITALFNEEKQLIGFSKVARDITERKKFEEQLKESEEHIKSIFKGAPDAVVVIDAAGNVVHWNPKAVEIFGWQEEEIIGKSLSDTIVPIQFREAHVTGMKRYLSTKKSNILGKSIQIKATTRRNDLLDIDLSISPIVMNNGYFFVGFIRDITEEKRIEAITLNNERRFRQALGILGDNVWEHDFPKDKTYFADTIHDLLGFPNDDLTDNVKLWWGQIHPDDRWLLEESDRKYKLKESDGHNLEYRMYHRNGSVVWVLDRGVVIDKDAKGNPLKIVGIHSDITKRKENEAALKQLNEDLERRTMELTLSNKELEQFAYVASHDLQEPLRMVSSFLQLLQKKYDKRLDETADKYIHLAVDGAARMKVLINDLLLLSRVGNKKEAMEEVDVNETVKTVLINLQPAIVESRAVFTIEKLPAVTGNSSQIEQLFQNLIGNAIKYRGAAAPEIKVGCIEAGKDWKFFVQDNGIGFDKNYAEKIFIIFQRLHTKSEYPGTGIGLAICKKIVQSHGGSFEVESEPGKGSTFYFTIKKGG